MRRVVWEQDLASHEFLAIGAIDMSYLTLFFYVFFWSGFLLSLTL